MSHIRALLKDDQLGLGARKGKADGEFGLDVFSSVLGRLNGKSEDELRKEEDRVQAVKAAKYTIQKLGSINFVSGGFLVGDKIEKLQRKELVRRVAVVGETESSEAEPRKRPKKRKRGGDAVEANAKSSIDDRAGAEKDSPTKKKRKQRKSEPASPASVQNAGPIEAGIQHLKPAESKNAIGEEEEKGRTKAERWALKDTKRQQKLERRRKAQKTDHLPLTPDDEPTSTPNPPSTLTTIMPAPSATDSPAPSGHTTPRGRHVVRSRYIQQKRMATLDAKALNEIFMIKSSAG